MAEGPPLVVAYCGAPPLPGFIWQRWNLDPVLMIALAAWGALYLSGAAWPAAGRSSISRSERLLFLSGWALVAVALTSPLCALSVSLFSARVGQHIVLALIAAPLVAAGRPGTALAVFSRFEWRTGRRLRSRWTGTLPASAVFTVLLWIWHAPTPYAATFGSPWVYWSMHLSMFGAALWLWLCLLDPTRTSAISAVAAGLLTSVQMGLLGALITLAPRPLYAPHAATTAVWGLTPLQDQQLGGAIMWIPGCIVFLTVTLITLSHVIADPATDGPGAAASAPSVSR